MTIEELMRGMTEEYQESLKERLFQVQNRVTKNVIGESDFKSAAEFLKEMQTEPNQYEVVEVSK